jgi:hypothetical protein
LDPLLVEVATLASLLDQLDDQLDRPGEGPPDLGLLVPVGDVVEVLDGLDLAGGGAPRERWMVHSLAPFVWPSEQ